MLRVLLVDDEVNVVEGLRSTVAWNEHDCEVVGTAFDGGEALDKAIMLKPDLVVTDITMPVINGIVLAERLKTVLPDTRVVFLTCHEEFDFARLAVKLDVTEYLVKETMTREELYAVLDRVRDAIEWERLQNEKSMSITMEMIKSRYLIGESLIRNLLDSKLNMEHDSEKRLKLYGFSFSCNKFLFSFLEIDRYLELLSENIYRDTELFKITVIKITQEILSENDLGHVFSIADNEFVIVYNFNPSLKISIQDTVMKTSVRIQRSIRTFFKKTCTLYIGKPCDSFYGITEEYARLKALRKIRFHLPDEALVTSDNIQVMPDELSDMKDDANDKAYLNKMLEAFKDGMQELDIAHTEKAIGLLLEVSGSKRTGVSEIWPYVDKILLIIKDNMERYGLKNENFYTMDFHDELKHIHSIFSLKDYLTDISRKSAGLIRSKAVSEPDKEIGKVIRYVQRRYHEEITLKTAAKHVCMNASYFSRYFKMKTGENFVDFLSRTRIGQAKELLTNTDLTIDEISEQVGHINKAYFSKVFKDLTGITPGEYRKQAKNKSEGGFV